MTENKMTPDDMLNSLTGFEEIAIAQAFSGEVLDLMERKPTTGMRALVFVLEKRTGKSDAEAKNAVLTMTLGQVQDHFADDDEIDPENPETALGEDVAQPA